jgi:tetratricopeptide (TPR) repeat protein
MSPQEIEPFFVRQLLAVLEHWQEQAATQDKAVLARLDNGRQNLFHIVNLGLEHSHTQTAAARLSLAVFPLVEQRGYWPEWIPVLERAIELQGGQVSALLFELHNRLGQLYRWERRIDEAIKAHLTAEVIAKQLADDHARANAWFNLSEDYNQIRRFDEAEKYGLLALEVFKELDVENKWLAAVYNSLGTNALNKGQLETAEMRLREAVRLSQQLDDSVSPARIIVNLAKVLRASQKFEEALAHYEEAGRILGGQGRTPDQVSVQIALGALYNDLDQLADAESAFRNALSPEFDHLGYTYFQAYALQGLGNVLLRMERFEEAEPILENAVAYWQELDQAVYQANSLGTLAETAAAQHDLERAVVLYKQAISLVENCEDDPFGQILLKELSDQLQAIINGSL